MPKCKVCKAAYERTRPMQVCCSVPCAIELAKIKRLKAEADSQRAEKKSIRERLKTRSDWMKEAQQSFNAWIRERDKDEPCISCQRYHSGQYHAGHYRSVGSNPALRFEPLNVHKQCSVCNNHKSGNLTEYRINLLKKIGQEKLDWLEGPHHPMKYTIEQLQGIRDNYRVMVRQAKKIPPDSTG